MSFWNLQDDSELTAAVLAILASPAGREAIQAALRHPLVGRQCKVIEVGSTVTNVAVTVVAVESSGMLRVRADHWPMEYEDFRVRPDGVEWAV